MSENTVNAARCQLGYDQEVMTGHGFRSMASFRRGDVSGIQPMHVGVCGKCSLP